ncbi:MAG: CoA-binding protein [Deltaproteobacteria bacterium]|nr:CoA-binding protein [Deltaproteobacteria bacterium]
MLHKKQNISFFFSPKSIAIIGSSPTAGKISYVILKSLRNIGFQGEIYPVNPKYKSIDDLKCYNSVSEIGKNIDLAVIAVPAPLVLDSLKDAGKKAKGAIIISAGFGEAGKEGRKMEDGIKEIAKETGIRVMGPNCMGVYDTVSMVDTFFVPAERMGRPGKGVISILSQSGSFASLIMDELALEGIGVSRVVSYGNRVDVGESDCLEFLAGDDNTKAVAIYMESVDDGRRFVEAAARCAKKKPVLAIKVGKRGAGISAAKSHTGAMTGMYKIYRAAFMKAGIIEIDGYEGLKDACRALNIFKPVKGRKVLIITDGGGIGVRISDACEEMGLDVAALPETLQKRLSVKFPAYYGINNPMDLTGSVTNEEYLTAIADGLKDNYDMAIVALLWGPPKLSEGLVDRLAETIRRVKKPALICSPGGTFTKRMNRAFEEKGIPVFSSPESAARAAAVLTKG